MCPGRGLRRAEAANPWFKPSAAEPPTTTSPITVGAKRTWLSVPCRKVDLPGKGSKLWKFNRKHAHVERCSEAVWFATYGTYGTTSRPSELSRQQSSRVNGGNFQWSRRSRGPQECHANDEVAPILPCSMPKGGKGLETGCSSFEWLQLG